MIRDKHVGNEEPYSYTFVMFNAATWLTYGIPTLDDETNTPVMIANGVGVFVEFIYVVLFLCYVAAGRRRMPLLTLVGAVAVSIVLLGLLLGLSVHTHIWSRTFMGWAAMLSGIAMYTIPLWRTVSPSTPLQLSRIVLLFHTVLQ